MIIQMHAGIRKEDPRVTEAMNKARAYGLKPKVSMVEGSHYEVVEIYLKDGSMQTSALSDHLFSALPGVETIRRVVPPKVTLFKNGDRDGKHFALGSTTIGAKLPCRLVAGPCTVDTNITEIAQKLKHLGITMIRGGCWKPRSRPYSMPGYGENAVRWLLEAARNAGMEAVFTEVMESEQIATVRRIQRETGYQGTIVLWVGARTENSLLLAALGKQYDFPVMLKNGLCAKGVGNLFERAEWVLAGPMRWNRDGSLDANASMEAGNDKVILCLRGTEKTDPQSAYRFHPNHDWAETLRANSWAPIAIDPSHSAGTMKDDLVLKNLRAALQHDIDLIMLEGGYPASGFGTNGFRGLCDNEQSVPFERFPEVLAMIDEHNRTFNKK